MTQGVKEQIGIFPAIETERHFLQIGREMLCTDLVPATHNAALKKRESGFDSVCVDVADYITVFAVVDGLVILNASLPHSDCVGPKIIRENDFRILVDIFTDVFCKCSRFCVFGMEEAQFATALTNPQHGSFVVHLSDLSFAVIPSANISGIHLELAIHHGLVGLSHRVPDAVAEIPCRLVAADPEGALNLASGHSLLGFTQQERCGKPLHEGQVGIIEYGSSSDGELVVAILAVEQLLFGFEFGHGAFAAQAAGTFREAQASQKLAALVFGRKQGIDVN